MATRRAVALLELLIAIAILVLLILLLLLPAVQKIRAANDRLKCHNNLKTIGAGFIGYHDARGHFPPGGDNADFLFTASVAPHRREAEWSWAYHLLPYTGQQAIHANPNHVAIFTTPIPHYYCPARRPPGVYNRWAKIDYAGNCGTHPRGLNGVVMRTRDGRVRRDDVTDGLGSTVAVAEKRLNTAMFGFSADDNEAYANPGWNNDWEVYRSAESPPTPDFRDPHDKSPRSNFGSSHPSAFSAAFCDGSVRSIRYSVNPVIWQRACVRNDHQSIDNLDD